MRSAIVGGGIPRLPRITDGLVDGRLGVFRGYLAAIGAKNESNLWDLNHVLANPGIYRFFSSESPKNKKSKDFIFFNFFIYLFFRSKCIVLMARQCITSVVEVI